MLRASILLPWIVAVLCVRPAAAQPELPPISVPYDIPALGNGSLDFGDLEGDGDLDLVITGETANERVIRIYRLNETEGVHTFSSVPLVATPVTYGTVRWGDYNGDGESDLLVAGLAADGSSERPSLHVYRNIGPTPTASRFQLEHILPGLYRSSADWGDYDGDGDLDFVVSGLPDLDARVPETVVYRQASGTFAPVETNLPGVVSGDVAWADYDGDGDLDLTILGDTGGGAFILRLYRNDDGTFVDSGFDFPKLAYGSVDWADFDGDGDPDLLATGGRLDPRFLRGVTTVYRNDDGVLRDAGFDLEGWTLGEAGWGDADRDGDLDIFVTGAPAALESPFLRLYVYDGSRYVPEWKLGGVRFGRLTVGDYNGDGDADVALLGELSGSSRFRFLLNWDYPECVDPSWVPQGAWRGADCPPPEGG